jgi:Photosynthesis system II assembly factor YCF48
MNKFRFNLFKLLPLLGVSLGVFSLSLVWITNLAEGQNSTHSVRDASLSGSRGDGQLQLPSPTTYQDPWLQYVTNVNPGGGLSFVNGVFGLRVDGRQNSPFDFGNLTSGVGGRQLIWPGSAVSATKDGGESWTQVAQPSDGVWGIDLVDSATGFIVGVDQLLATHDAGVSWTQLSEPTLHPFVRVAFSNAKSGVGIDTTGTLYTTSDGGQNWLSQPSTSVAAGVCSSGSTIFEVLSDGTVRMSNDGAGSWVVLVNFPEISASQSAWYDISCSTTETSSVTATYFPNSGVASPTFVSASGGVDSSSWKISTVSEQSPLVVSAGQSSLQSNVVTLSSLPASGSIVQMRSNSNGGLQFALAGLSVHGLTQRMGHLVGKATSLVPSVLHAQDLILEGASTSAESTWIQVESTASGKGSQTCILVSRNHGSSWTVANCSLVKPLLPPVHSTPKYIN